MVRNGATATWSYDLARSVIYSRQGDPANAGVERDGIPPIRTNDVFYGAIDLDRVSTIPHADIQMRLFSRMIADLLADAMPLPHLWYFPNASRTMLVLTGDAHGNPDSNFQEAISVVEARGARMSFYLSRFGSFPTSSEVSTWRARGHEFGMRHPFATPDNQTINAGLQDGQSYFSGQNYGTPSRTTRIHLIEWQGWADAAQLEANYNVGLDTTFYTIGPAVTYSGTNQANGYINGSGLPMRFINQSGNIVPVYQQVTSLIDEQLIVGSSSEGLSPNQALAVSRQLIDDSQAGGYSAITTQFHSTIFRGAQCCPGSKARWITPTASIFQCGLPSTGSAIPSGAPRPR